MDGAELVRLKDRLDINDVYCRYARGVDRRDWELVRNCFHPDGILNHLSYQGDVSGFIEWLKLRHAMIPISIHFVGRGLIEFVNDKLAFVETYGMAFQRISADAKAHKNALLGDTVSDTDEVECELLLRYADKFKKQHGEWRISHQNLISDARRTRIATAGSWALGSPLGAGMRSMEDVVYRVRRELGVKD